MNHRNFIKVKQYLIHYRQSKRGWAVVIMPDKIRVDNFHGFPHIHFGEDDKTHRVIKINDLNTVLRIIVEYLDENEIINPKNLERELK